MQNTIRLQSLPFSSVRTYLTAAIFILGNILLLGALPGNAAVHRRICQACM